MIIAANFKCHHTRASFRKYLAELEILLADETPQNRDIETPQNRRDFGVAEQDCEIIIAPAACAFLEDLPRGFIQAAQNFYPAENGAFTGEIGAAHLDEFGIRTVIIGHCERRALGESDEFLARKFAFAKERGWRIIYCIGEDAATYERGERLDFCAQQLRQIDLAYEGLIIAYEPIYSIGKSAASSADIAAMMRHLRALAPGVPLLYGGSVNSSNIAEFIGFTDGVLVGSASLQAKEFAKLIKSARHEKNI